MWVGVSIYCYVCIITCMYRRPEDVLSEEAIHSNRDNVPDGTIAGLQCSREAYI